MAGRHAGRQVSPRGRPKSVDQLRIPVARAQVPQLRARRALRVGQEGPLGAQPEGEETRLRSPAQRAGLARRTHRGQVVQRPAQLARTVMRRQEQAGLAMHVLGMRLELAQPAVRAPVLPAEQRRQRPAVAPVPADAARALAGQARRHHPVPACAQRRQRLARRGEDRLDHLLAVLLGPVGLRPHQADVARALREHARAAVEHHRTAGVGALVDGQVERSVLIVVGVTGAAGVAGVADVFGHGAASLAQSRAARLRRIKPARLPAARRREAGGVARIDACAPSSHSTRAPPVRAPCCSTRKAASSPARSARSARSTRNPAGSSTIRANCGKASATLRARPSRKRTWAPKTCSPPASPTSARPPWCGTGRRASRCTTPSSGRTGAPPRCASSCALPAWRRRCAPGPAWCSTRISAPPSWPGSSTTSPARASAASAASWPSAPSTPGWCGTCRRARCTSPIRPTPRARCCSTSTPATGTPSCCASSACRAPCCPTCSVPRTWWA